MTVNESEILNERLNIVKHKIIEKSIKSALFDLEYIMKKIKQNTI